MDAVASISEKVGDLGDYLREQREGAKLSVRQLATLAGVSNPYLSQIERGLRKPSAEVLQQIAKGLRISAEALYVRAGILDGEGRPDVEAAIGADPALTDRQRRALLDIYTSFCAENARVGLDAAPPARRPLARRMARTATSKASATKASAAEAATTKTPAAKTATAKRATVKSSVTAKPVTAKPVTAKSSATKTPATKRAATTRAASKTAAKKATTKAGAPKTSRTAKTQQNPSSDG
ncbi:MAG: helix-turn-helix transcriptional regulator [Kineosporiaceae bacterium]|nr:helix-turn-helix transcriptional regulator [Kineosporiaceae bacterium]